MALTPSNMLPLGTKAPGFNLMNVADSKLINLTDLKPKNGLVVMFICNHCPYVIHIIEGIISMANDFREKGFEFIAINSNDTVRYPQDSPENMRKWSQDLNFPFPYLFDEDQNVAKTYDAACTPDFYVFDSNKDLVYRGQMDDARPGNDIKVSGETMRIVLNNILEKKTISKDQKPSLGCGIKWK